MEQFLKTPINKLNIAQIFAFLFLISLFFPIRYGFLTPSSYILGQYSDFTSYFLYLSDILLFTTWGFTFLPRGGDFFRFLWSNKALILLISWLFISYFLNFRHSSANTLYFLVKTLEVIVAYGTFSTLFSIPTFKNSIRAIFFNIFSILGGIQSLIALFQFWKQSPLGLYKLGEQQVYPYAPGIAKIVLENETHIRGYGTFPHPNILSAFLILAIFTSIYLLINSSKLKAQFLYGSLIIINIFGLIATFSRASYMALAFSMIVFYLWILWRKKINPKILASIILLVIGLAGSFLTFKPFLMTRATFTDQASLERTVYSKIAIKIIKDSPLAGVGLGESVLHMQQYSPTKLWPWQIQPIHNYLLISAAEIGIIGTLILLWIFFSHVISLFIHLEHSFDPYTLVLTAILFSFLILMQFDHYFYTLQQTQMLLWVLLGIISAQIKIPLYPKRD